MPRNKSSSKHNKWYNYPHQEILVLENEKHIERWYLFKKLHNIDIKWEDNEFFLGGLNHEWRRAILGSAFLLYIFFFHLQESQRSSLKSSRREQMGKTRDSFSFHPHSRHSGCLQTAQSDSVLAQSVAMLAHGLYSTHLPPRLAGRAWTNTCQLDHAPMCCGIWIKPLTHPQCAEIFNQSDCTGSHCQPCSSSRHISRQDKKVR